MGYKNVAFIPVRGGSKSIPLKNIKNINGRPLVYWVLDAAGSSKYIDRVYVSTDSTNIRDMVNAYGNDKVEIIGRSLGTAGDKSTTESAMLEFAYKYDFENVILIQATSPLTDTGDIDRGFKKLFFEGYDSILSVTRQKRFIWEDGQDGYIPVNYDYRKRPMRQEFEGYFVENGAFYITSRDKLLKSGNRLSGRIGTIEMNEETYFEIDEPADWIIVEELLKRKKNGSNFDINKRFGKIKLLITDSDGVLTDGGMYYSEDGNELKKFNTRDGMGVQILKELGIDTIIITGENVELVKNRAIKLGIKEYYIGIKDKGSLVKKIAQERKLGLEQIAYIGDDINDLEAIKIVGLGCSVLDGVEKVKQAAVYITKAKGGEGALREVAEMIMKNKDTR